MKLYFEYSLLCVIENETSWRFYVKNPYKILYQLGRVQENDILTIDYQNDIIAGRLLMSKILKKPYAESLM